MAMFKPKPVDTTGFSAKTQFEGSRLMDKHGRFNVIKKGLPFQERFSFYHFLVTVSWTKLILLASLFFILINILFTFLYISIDCDQQFSGVENTTQGFDRFLTLFYFSIQTFTTVGYGNISPVGKISGLFSSIEAFSGLCTFALISGILYGRFSKPKARIKFSHLALISPYQDGKAFMLRLANAKNSDMIELEGRLIYSGIELGANGEPVRKFYPMPLEISKVSFLPTSWTLVHAIKEDSPLWNLNHQDLENQEVEILIQLIGYDETYNQTVHSRSSYKPQDIIWNARFKNIFATTEDGMTEVDLSRLDDYSLV